MQLDGMAPAFSGAPWLGLQETSLKLLTSTFITWVPLKAVGNYACTYLQDQNRKLWEYLLEPGQSLSQCPA